MAILSIALIMFFCFLCSFFLINAYDSRRSINEALEDGDYQKALHISLKKRCWQGIVDALTLADLHLLAMSPEKVALLVESLCYSGLQLSAKSLLKRAEEEREDYSEILKFLG